MNYYQSGYVPHPMMTTYPAYTQPIALRDNTFSTRRIQFDAASASDNNLNVFIITNSLEAPIVCLADNNGFPHVRDFYARARTYQGYNGVHLTIRFESSPANGRGFAVNIAQPGMNGNFSVFPL
ncbi:hypothetical protein [Paenibacillus polymyxa]|uniref:hypothetical protein n=1 Tax=Paenibacillus polymyxa TaxID=1406 RepID=UPI00321623CA